MQPLVSIIVPYFNEAGRIARALQSIFDQSYKPIEVVVVDDGSTDDTPNVLRSYSDRIKLITTRNQGVSAARNTALDVLKGKYWANLDADNRYSPHFVQRMVELLESRDGSQYACAYCQRTSVNEQGDIVRRTIFPPFDLSLLKVRSYIDANCCMYRREAVATMRFDPDFSIWEDYEFALRIALSGGRFILLDDSLVEYAIRASSASGKGRKTYRQREAMNGLLAKHGYQYTRAERRLLRQSVSRKIRLCIVQNRSKDARLASRLNDLVRWFREGGSGIETLMQLYYTLAPSHFYRRNPDSTPKFSV